VAPSAYAPARSRQIISASGAALYDTLLQRNVLCKPQPRMAEKTFNAANAQTTMKIAGMKFSDGTALDPEAVKASFGNIAKKNARFADVKGGHAGPADP
jgi:ABC-type transport system substrate-binding protein